jgi:hypothetical protein
MTQRNPDPSPAHRASRPKEADSGHDFSFSELRVTDPWHVEIGLAAVPEIERRGKENPAFNPQLMQLVKRLEEHPLEFAVVQSMPGRRRAMLERLYIYFDVVHETRWVVI